jgi:hypothetical protein
MFRVGRNEKILIDVNARSRALLHGDGRQTIEEFVQYLLRLQRSLRGDPVADLRIGVQHASVVADLRQSADPAHCGGGGKGTQVMVVDVGRKPGRSERIKPGVLVQVDGKTIGAESAIEGDEKLPLTSPGHALNVPDKARSLRKKKLLVVMGVVVGREHHDHGTSETAVDVVG